MVNEFSHIEHPFNMDLAYFNIYIQDDEIFVPWKFSESNPEKCIYKKEVRVKKDLEDGILNAKWSTIDIPLINFNHFNVLDSIYFGNGVYNRDCDNLNISDKSFIQKLRDGIRNGTIVKEMQPDGSYIWRKVRK